MIFAVQPTELTLCNLYSYFALNHILNTYDIYMSILIYPIDSVHYKLSFTGALICLFGCGGIFVEPDWINVPF